LSQNKDNLLLEKLKKIANKIKRAIKNKKQTRV